LNGGSAELAVDDDDDEDDAVALGFDDVAVVSATLGAGAGVATFLGFLSRMIILPSLSVAEIGSSRSWKISLTTDF